VLRRRWALLAVTTLLGLVAGALSAVFASNQTQAETVYTASETIVANSGSGANPLIAQDTLKVTRGEVPVRAAVILGEPDRAGALASTIDASFDSESSSISIASNDVDKAVAQQRTRAFVQAFLEVTNAKLQADSRRQLEQQQADLLSTQQQLAQFDATYPQFSTPGGVLPNDLATQQLSEQRSQLTAGIQELTQQVKDAELQLSRTAPYESLGPEEPHPAATGLVSVPTSLPVRAALMGLLGLLLGAGVAVVIERVSRRIDTRDELVEVVDLPILAEIGFLKEAKRAHDADGVLALEGVWAEPYRRVRSAIQFVQATGASVGGGNAVVNGSGMASGAAHRSGRDGARPAVFLITSTAPGEGKSTTAALTGEALAETGQPTVVVGGDFRRPEIDRLMGVPREPSLLEMAQMSLDRPTVDDVVHPSRFPSLYVAPAGKGTREVSGSIEAAKEVATEAVSRGATVIFDSSPLQAANDTIDLLPVVDYVILVVRSGRSTEASLREVVETLQRMDARILGVVLIGTPSAGRRQTYYYDYYSPSADKPEQSVVSGRDGRGAPPVPPVGPGTTESATGASGVDGDHSAADRTPVGAGHPSVDPGAHPNPLSPQPGAPQSGAPQPGAPRPAASPAAPNAPGWEAPSQRPGPAEDPRRPSWGQGAGPTTNPGKPSGWGPLGAQPSPPSPPTWTRPLPEPPAQH